VVHETENDIIKTKQKTKNLKKKTISTYMQRKEMQRVCGDFIRAEQCFRVGS